MKLTTLIDTNAPNGLDARERRALMLLRDAKMAQARAKASRKTTMKARRERDILTAADAIVRSRCINMGSSMLGEVLDTLDCEVATFSAEAREHDREARVCIGAALNLV